MYGDLWVEFVGVPEKELFVLNAFHIKSFLCINRPMFNYEVFVFWVRRLKLHGDLNN